MSNQTKHKRPQYNLEFKQEAAKLVIEKNHTHQQAADCLGISLSAIDRWVRAERESTTVTSETSSVLNLSGQSELRRLREEFDQLRLQCEREFYRKVA